MDVGQQRNQMLAPKSFAKVAKYNLGHSSNLAQLRSKSGREYLAKIKALMTRESSQRQNIAQSGHNVGQAAAWQQPHFISDDKNPANVASASAAH